MKTIGSQKRETLQEAGAQLIGCNGKEAVISMEGKPEMWALNDDFAGYVIEINGKGYEFIRSLT